MLFSKNKFIQAGFIIILSINEGRIPARLPNNIKASGILSVYNPRLS